MLKSTSTRITPSKPTRNTQKEFLPLKEKIISGDSAEVKKILESMPNSRLALIIKTQNVFVKLLQDNIKDTKQQCEIIQMVVSKSEDYKEIIPQIIDKKQLNDLKEKLIEISRTIPKSAPQAEANSEASSMSASTSASTPSSAPSSAPNYSEITNPPKQDTTKQITKATPIQQVNIVDLTIKELQNGNLQAVKQAIFKGDILNFASYPGIIDAIEEQITDYTERQKMLRLFLEKIEAVDDSTSKSFINTQMFKAQCWYAEARSILSQYKDCNEADVKREHYKNLLKLCDDANTICVNQEDPPARFHKLSEDILEFVTTSIAEYDNQKDAYVLARHSLDSRQQQVKENTQTTLKALISAIQTGIKIADGDNKITLEVNQLSLQALNVATALNDHNQKADIYSVLATMHRDILKDARKADAMEALAKAYRDDNFTIDPETKFNLTPITKFGSMTEQDLQIKLAIQDCILNPIYDIAKTGKWYNKQLTLLGFTEYGISGYIDKAEISKHLGYKSIEASEDNINTALKFCFEAINLGIINSKEKNPLCSTIFVQKYPNLVSDIIKNNPEFVIDGFILKTSIPNAHKISMELIGIEIEENITHNKYFEDAILSFVQTRIIDSVFSPVKNQTLTTNWNNTSSEKIKNLLSDTHLTGRLGQNLGEIQDIFNIVRVAAFKVIMDTIIENNDSNYAALIAFCESIQGCSKTIFDRIKATHHVYFRDGQTDKIFTKYSDTKGTPDEGSDLASKDISQPDLFSSVLNAKDLISKTYEKDTGAGLGIKPGAQLTHNTNSELVELSGEGSSITSEA